MPDSRVGLPYPNIRTWGHLMGSRPYYVADQIERARSDRAPQDAVYLCDHSHAGIEISCPLARDKKPSHWITLPELSEKAQQDIRRTQAGQPL
jgi:hypothetical protein